MLSSSVSVNQATHIISRQFRIVRAHQNKQVVDWLTDLSWVPNGAVVFITAESAGQSFNGKKARTSPEPPSGGKKATAAATPTTKTGGRGEQTPHVSAATAKASSGDGAERVADDEDDDEAVALAALSRIRESYKRRARGRDRETRDSGVSSEARQDEDGRRMLEKSRQVAQTERFRQARRGSKVGLFLHVVHN